MNTIWILLAFSTGSYTQGMVTVVERFRTQQECKTTLANITMTFKVKDADFLCVEANPLPR